MTARDTAATVGQPSNTGALLKPSEADAMASDTQSPPLPQPTPSGAPPLSCDRKADRIDLQHRLHVLLLPSKEALYPNDKHRMSDATLEAYIRQLLESHREPRVTVAWQGGEPTLMKLDFFRHAVELVEQHRRSDQVKHDTFQTNGMLLDDSWCAFFKPQFSVWPQR